MSFDEACHRLVGEPYYLTIEQIRRLTPYQMRWIYNRQSDDEVRYQSWKRGGGDVDGIRGGQGGAVMAAKKGKTGGRKRGGRRRRNGEGSVYSVPGGWRAAVVDPTTPSGRRYFSGPTETAVLQKVEQWRQKQAQTKKLREGLTGDWSVAEWLDHWLESIQQPVVAPSSFVRLRQIIAKALKPGLGAFRLHELSAESVEAHVASLSQSHGPDAARRALVVLRSSLKRAVIRRALARNVASEVSLPRRPFKEVAILTTAEVRTLLAAASSHRLFPLFLLLCLTGMRVGEVLALREDDFDWTTPTVRVARNLSFVHPYGFLVKEPKTAQARRIIDFDSAAVPALRDWLAFSRRLLGNHSSPPPAFFHTYHRTQGSFLRATNLLNHVFLPMLRRAGLPRVRLHSLRHSHATHLLSVGVPIHVVSRRLGHANVTITLQHYGHVLSHDQRAASDAAARLYLGF